MPPSSHNRHVNEFESLTVIVSLAIVIAIASLVTTFPGWQGEQQVSGISVQGYSMPAHLRNQPVQNVPLNTNEGLRRAFRETFKVPQTEQEIMVAERFTQAISLMHAKRYDYAITALDAVLALAPRLPEAYVNMGYAFIGLEEYGPAQGAFEKALEFKLDQINAYYGLAIALEGLGDLEPALGAMRTYIHLSDPNDPFLAKARSALWEWEAQLGRIDGVEVAPEGVPGQSIKAPNRSNVH